MSIKVIGAGWGRTGTTSLRKALELLGFGPCYHWSSIREKDVPLWEDVLAGEPDWSALLDGFSSVIDWPASHFYGELAAAYPEAKVILTHRDSGDWYKSARRTVYAMLETPLERFDGSRLGWPAATAQSMIRTTREVSIDRALGRPFEERPHHDEAWVRERFDAHLRTVQQTIPADRLLTFELGGGWEPLCAFLGVDVPSEPYPHKNRGEEFRKRNDM